jgi:hypothetical protein
LGDQAAVIPSFTGDGMSIALHSATLAAQMYLAGESADQYHEKLHAHLSRGMGLATALSRAMVTGVGRTLAPIGLSFSQAMHWIARSTRIPQKGLHRAPEAITGNERVCFRVNRLTASRTQQPLERSAPRTARRKVSATRNDVKLGLRNQPVHRFSLARAA